MSYKIKWGIISTGHISGKFATALALLPEAELLAVASRDRKTASQFAAKYNIPKAYASYAELADDPDVDVVYIGTPHTFHLENSLMCMRKGKAVLCEKAFAINGAEAREMVRVAREENVFLMEAMITRHVPLIKKVQGWISEGRIGEVRMVKASRCARGEFKHGARQLNPELGGGSLLDVGIYVISFASMIFGKSPVEAVGLSHIGDWGSDEQGVAILKYDKGEMADLSFALRTAASNEAYILGTDGYIKVHDVFAVPTKASLFIDRKEVEVIEEPIIGNALNYEAEEVMRCLKLGLKESPLMPLDESIQIMEIMDQIRKPWGLVYSNDKIIKS
ncbi:MAG: Gfo/Idh/MocA family oxidoreductase [Prolixibacteraceae bacterium]|nr:Gfo/Idh/MocA family oxidoreductase [Prolixibacteraceae bacterium]